MRNFVAAVALTLLMTVSTFAQVMSVDFVSRYIWRGLDQGEGIAIQPTFTVNAGLVNVGVWGSSGIEGGVNEVDVVVSQSFVNGVQVSLTDYYTGGDYLEIYGEEGNHDLEVGVSYGIKYGSLLGGMFLDEAGDDRSTWLQATLNGPYGTSVLVGAGNGRYTEDGEPALTLAGLSVASERSTVSYLVNADTGQAWIVGAIRF